MIVMSIAGVDPSGGAGIFADIKTFQALGVYGTGIVTALTAQNPQKMYSLKAIETSYVEEQIDAILDTYNVEYIKTGMLYSTDIIKSVSKKIREYNLKAVVDPVMVATSGGELAKNDLSQNLLKYLLPKAILTTPNVSEAEKLTNIKITNEEEAKKACEKFVEQFEKRLRQEVSYITEVPYKMSFRRIVEYQIMLLIKALESNNADIYKPVLIRWYYG